MNNTENRSTNLEKDFEQACQYHQQGNLELALSGYENILSINPEHADALHLKGVVLYQQENHQSAKVVVEKAIAINAHIALYHSHLGNIYFALEDYQQSIRCYHKAIDLDSQCSDFFYNLANSHYAAGQINKAGEAIEQAIELNSENAEFYLNYGVILSEQGKQQQAITAYEKGLSLAPSHSGLYNNLGNIYQILNQYSKALSCYKKSLEYNAAQAEICYQIALIKQKQDPADYDSLIYYLNLAYQIDPGNYIHCQQLIHQLWKIGDLNNALDICQQCAKLHANNPEFTHSFAILLRDTGFIDEAKNLFLRTIKLAPDKPESYYHLARLLASENKLTEAITYNQKAYKKNTEDIKTLFSLVENLQEICDWDTFHELFPKLAVLVKNSIKENNPVDIPPLKALSLPFASQTVFDIVSRFTQKNNKDIIPFTHNSKKKKKIKIAYISSDFCNHPVGFLVNDLFQYHNRNEFIIYAYLTAPIYDKTQEVIRDACDFFIDISTDSYFNAAKKINQDAIDILVDLTGYTQYGKPQILAYQPAPIQCHMLGYPGTLAAPFMQYILSHKTVIPEALNNTFSEKCVYLKETPFASKLFDNPCPKLKRTDLNLPQDKFIFCFLNQTYRITAPLFSAWMNILNETPNSVLWLQTNSDIVSKSLKKRAMQHHVDSHRLIFSKSENLSQQWRHQVADLWLDSFSLSSGTASILCACAELPLLTLAGNAMQARTAAGYMKAAGLNELITHSIEQYTEKAIEIANNPAVFRTIKNKLKNNIPHSPLFNQKSYIKQLETAYKIMHEKHTAQEEPSIIDLS